MKLKINRRDILKGTFYGSAVGVGLPLLNCFLNEHGTALADTGQPLPNIFGSWFQYLGFNPGRWVPQGQGENYRNNIELQMFDRYRERMNIISGANYFLDGRPVETHRTGVQIAMLGGIPTGRESGPSLDSDIADVIGTATRFRTIDVTGTGGQSSVSKQAGAMYNPAEPSPEALYQRIFGPDFQDPNAAEFTPDPKVLAKQSVLSQVAEQRRKVMRMVGTEDRARLDAYFTSVRQIEQQLAMQNEKPAPLPACSVPNAIGKERLPGSEVRTVARNVDLFGSLIANALACGQTRVFSVSMNTQGCHKEGSTNGWHAYTHEEPIDEALGYQKEVTWFILWANNIFADFIGKLAAMPEGNGSVLDRTFLLWQTDHGYARTHTMDNVSIMTVGDGGGVFRTGQHIALSGDPASRVGLTVQQGFRVPVSSWGALSNTATRTITDLLA